MAINGYQKVLVGYLILLVIAWIALHSAGYTDSVYNYLYSLAFSLTPLLCGIVALTHARIWGGIKSHVGRAVFFVGLGIFLWGAGSMVWSYYNLVLHVDVPYPSLADLGFAPSVFFYGLGAVYLSQATGAKFTFRKTEAKVFAFIALLAILAIAYYFRVTVAQGGVLIPTGDTSLKAILDVAYPLGDLLGLAIAIIVSGLSFKYLGGRYLADIISILLGLGVMYVGDFIFSYTTTVGTFYNGDAGDLVLTFGLFFLSYGVLGFSRMKMPAETP